MRLHVSIHEDCRAKLSGRRGGIVMWRCCSEAFAQTQLSRAVGTTVTIPGPTLRSRVDQDSIEFLDQVLLVRLPQSQSVEHTLPFEPREFRFAFGQRDIK